MERALLCVLLSLLLLPGRVTGMRKGEVCRAWMDRTELPAGPFRCPRASDEADATFCCGTCRLPFCCSSRVARLDQQQCIPDGQREATISPRQVAGTTKHLPHAEARVQHLWVILLAISAGLVSACVVCIALHIRNQLRIQRWLRTPAEELPPELVRVFSNPSLVGAPDLAGASRKTGAPSPGAEDPPSTCEVRSALDNPPAVKSSEVENAAALPTNIQGSPCHQPRKRNRHCSD